jgi:protein-S-isoprenylcysteine O-methyltransferase Ste14
VRRTVSTTIDWGRLIAVPFFSLAIFGNAVLLPRLWREDRISLVSTLAVLTFYGLLIVQYLRRGPATQSDSRPLVWIVALTGMLAPFAILPLSPGDASSAISALGSLVITIGLAGAVWALWHLGRNISVIPQVRSVSSSGPYRVLRHPLYVFELVAASGLVLVNGGGLGWAVVGLAAVCLWVRARWEEQLLARELPAYRDYLERR